MTDLKRICKKTSMNNSIIFGTLVAASVVITAACVGRPHLYPVAPMPVVTDAADLVDVNA